MKTAYDGFLADIYDYCPYFRDRGNTAVFYLKELALKCSNILELGTATGSITIPLAEAGYIVDTVDFSNDMHNITRRKTVDSLQDISQRINYILADITVFRPQKKYGAVIIPDSLLTIFLEKNQREKVLKMCYNALEEGGLLILDVYQPIERIIKKGIHKELSRFRGKNKEVYLVTVYHEININEQLHSCVYNYRKWRSVNGPEDDINIQIAYRYLYPAEVREALTRIGFHSIKVTEIFDGNINFITAQK